jgi:hypothetical protein
MADLNDSECHLWEKTTHSELQLQTVEKKSLQDVLIYSHPLKSGRQVQIVWASEYNLGSFSVLVNPTNLLRLF